MKKKILALITAAATCFSLTACNTNTTSGNSGAGNSGDSGSGDSSSSPTSSGSVSTGPISLRVWGPEEDQSLLVEMVDKFKAAYPDQQFEIEIGVESESSAKDDVLTDISAAADVYAFASDQLNSLVAANALANLDDLNDVFKNITGKSIDDIKAANNAGCVAAATINGSLYALPLGAGNNYFLLYDKSKLTESDVETWDGLLDAANAAGKKAGMVLNSGWYNAGFFLGAGFTASLNEDGSTNIDWNGTSSTGITGVQVVEGMIKIASNPAFMSVNDGETGNHIADQCALVSGSWDMEACQKIWGAENVGVAKLPTFTVDGKQVQQGCFSGFKLMAVNAMSKQVGWATVLAEFLTNEESQTLRYQARQLAPTNNAAAATDAVQADPMIAASLAQDAAGGVNQDVGDNYWEPTKTFGAMIAQNQLASGDTAAIQEALDNMVAGVTAPIA